MYIKTSNPDRIQPSYNDGGFCEGPYDIQRVEWPSAAPYTNQVTYRAYTNETSFRAHPLNSRRQQHEPIRFPPGRHTLHTTMAHQQETDLNFLRNFRTASNVIRPDREAPYIMTNVSAPPEFTDPRHLVHPVAPMGLLFTALIVPRTPARVSIGPCFPMTKNFMTNTPVRMRSSPTHGLMNGIGNTNQTIVVTDQIPILGNLLSDELCQFI